MNKFIKNIIYFSLRHRYLIFFFTGILALIGVISYRNTPIETFPDVTNTQVVIIAQWPGRSAEEVEKFVTIPMETVLNSVQKKSNLRTTSAFGLSYTRFEYSDLRVGKPVISKGDSLQVLVNVKNTGGFEIGRAHV